MTNLNESNVLLNTTFADSLNEGEFTVKITSHESNVVYGECIEVEIRHNEDEEIYFHGTYDKEEFPSNFFKALPNDWDYVEEKIRELYL